MVSQKGASTKWVGVFGLAAAGVALAATVIAFKRAGGSRPQVEGEAKVANIASGSAPATAPKSAPVELTNQQLSDITQAVNMANAMKQKGNGFLAAGKVEEAMSCYQDTLDFLSNIPSVLPDVSKTRQVVGANLLHCVLKKNLFVEGQLLASDLLEQGGDEPMPDELKAKVIFRRAMCSVGLGQADAALADLEAANVVAKGLNADITRELAKLK